MDRHLTYVAMTRHRDDVQLYGGQDEFTARANYLPKVNLEVSATTGDDVNGVYGNTNDVQGRVVARWNLYRGGIDVAREQEQIRRASEQRLVYTTPP